MEILVHFENHYKYNDRSDILGNKFIPDNYLLSKLLLFSFY